MKTIAIAALAGLATAAAAQDFSLTLVPSVGTVDTSGGAATFTVTAYGDSSFGTHMLGGAFGIAASSGGDTVQGMSWANAAWSLFNTDGGYAGNGNHNTVIFGQLVIPGIFPPAAGSELGSAIGSFTVTVDGAGVLVLDMTNGTPFSLEAVNSVSGQTMNDGGTVSLGSATINVIPAPSAMALLGLGGIVAGRRRR